MGAETACNRLVNSVVVYLGLLAALVCAAELPVSFRHLSTAAGDLPVPFPGTQQTACVVGQIVPGGPQEFVVTERTRSPSIVWYRFRAGRFERFVLEPEPLRIEAGGVLYDVDGDGDGDLILGEDASGDRMFWWENPGPASIGKTWKRRLVKQGGGNKHHDQAVGDFDGDGRGELAFWNQGQRALCVAEIPDYPASAASWPVRVIYRWQQGEREHEGLVAADVDRDGLTDLVGAGLWFRSKGSGVFEVHDVLPEARFTRAVAADLIPGGYLELVFVPGDADGACVLCLWDGNAWQKRVLEAQVIHGHTLQAGDIDADGDVDLFLAEMGRWGRAQSNPEARMMLYLNRGDGTLDRVIMSKGMGNHESKLADVNGDGRPDIVGKPYNWMTPRLDIWLNEGVARGALRGPQEAVVMARLVAEGETGADRGQQSSRRERVLRWSAVLLMALTLVLVVFVGTLLVLWALRLGGIVGRKPAPTKEPLYDIWFENDPRRRPAETNGGSETS